MAVSEDRIKAFRIMTSFIKQGMEALEKAGLLGRDEFGFIYGNMTNYFLDQLERYYDSGIYTGGKEPIEIQRDYYALWKFPEKTDWELKKEKSHDKG